jgi:hypothetical protein
LAKDLLWELEKLRRQLGVDGKEIEAAAHELGLKRRGVKEYTRDHEHLARMRTGGMSARKIAAEIGGPDGGAATETRISRKSRKANLQAEYWHYLEELADLLALLTLRGLLSEREAYTNRIVETAGPLPAKHLILMDLTDCSLRRVLDGNRIPADDIDHLERARFHGSMVYRTGRNSTLRFRDLHKRVPALEVILQELRAKKIT